MGLLGLFLNVLDASHGRLQTTLVTGAGPGEPEATAISTAAAAAPPESISVSRYASTCSGISRT
jgi:hypothetical protein